VAIKSKKILVIDTDILRSAGIGDNPDASLCFKCLQFTLSISHRVAVSTELLEEWEKHESHLAHEWRTDMKIRDKLLSAKIPIDNLQEIIYQLDQFTSTQHEAMKKDLHLIRIALLADKIIISKDSAARKLFNQAAAHIDELRAITWVDLLKDKTAIEWLKRGAPPEKKRRLGYKDGQP
jgi:hypothetical protein